MRLHSTHTPKVYKSALKERMGSHFAIGSERFTGIFMGKLFYVTHHAGYEWNRRITNQKNAALGFIKTTESGSEIRFLLFQSVLCPQYLILYLLICGGYAVGTWPVMKVSTLLIAIEILILIGIPLLIAFFESLTEGSVEGRKSLLGLLTDPADFFAYLHHQKELR